MKGLLKPSFSQRHPIVAGQIWAALTLVLMSIYELATGRDVLKLFISIPIFMIGGIGWGYAMKWFHDWKAGRA